MKQRFLLFLVLYSASILPLSVDEFESNIKQAGGSRAQRQCVLDGFKKEVITSKQSRTIALGTFFALMGAYNRYIQKPLRQWQNFDFFGTTQTETYLRRCGDKFLDRFDWRSYWNTPEIKSLINQVAAIEEREHKKGRFVFFHGCSWSFDIRQDLFTRLWELERNISLTNYRFIRFTNRFLESNSRTESRHKELMKDGLLTGPCSELFYCTTAFFAGDTSSNPFHYWLDNSTCLYSNDNDLEDVFGEKLYYQKYRYEFEELNSLHKAAQNKGLILVVSVTPKFAKHNIYSNGYLLGNAPGETYLMDIGGTRTTNPVKIFKAFSQSNLRRSYFDRMHYCMVMSCATGAAFDIATIQKNEIEIYPVHTAHPKEYAEYCKKRDELMEKIRHDIATDPIQKSF